MVLVERIRKMLGQASQQHGRLYGPSWALAGAAAASLFWMAVLGTSRLSPDVSTQLATLQDRNAPRLLNPLSETPLLEAPSDPSTIKTWFTTGEILPVASIQPVAFRPLHQRENYCVEPPDMLLLEITADEPADEALLRNLNREYLVEPNGTIRLSDSLGEIHVAGKTLREINAAVEERLKTEFENPLASTTVSSQNSHTYYVIVPRTDDAHSDMAYRFPAVGDETVYDALTRIDGLGDLSQKKIFISRPTANGDGNTMLPVDWDQLRQKTASSENWPIQPGDRIFVSNKQHFWEIFQSCLTPASQPPPYAEKPAEGLGSGF